MTINNIELYRLRVDRDSITTDHDEDTKYIHYDMEWKRIDDNLLKVVYPPKHDEEPALVVEEAPTVGVEAPKPADNKPRESKPAEQPKPSKPDPTSPSEEEPSEEQEPAPSTEPTTE